MTSDFDPCGWVTADTGPSAGLLIARIHAVMWADGVAPDGTAVRVFGWWVAPDGPWAYEVWQPGTSTRDASAGPNPGRTTRLLDERGLGLYDEDGHHLNEWRYYDPASIALDTALHTEHAYGSTVQWSPVCDGCKVEDAIADAAWEQFLDGRED